ncbi:MAG TPA: hypothetical protein VG713_11910 [Pirellulales bacterium]|nr:hypothetical protein [Pirellulales bacterium]
MDLELTTVSRVTVITDATLKNEVIAECLRLGANGYTSWPCDGKGEHKMLPDLFSSNAGGGTYLEFIVRPEVAKQIIAYCAGPRFRSHAMTAYEMTINVSKSDSF